NCHSFLISPSVSVIQFARERERQRQEFAKRFAFCSAQLFTTDRTSGPPVRAGRACEFETRKQKRVTSDSLASRKKTKSNCAARSLGSMFIESNTSRTRATSSVANESEGGEREREREGALKAVAHRSCREDHKRRSASATTPQT